MRAFSHFSNFPTLLRTCITIGGRVPHLRAGSPPQAAAWPWRWTGFSPASRRHRTNQVFRQAVVSPVLTAHPTEVQHRSILDRQLTVAHLLNERDRMQVTPDELRNNEEGFAAPSGYVADGMLRPERLSVYGEIKNGLAYYRYTFLTKYRAFTPRLKSCLNAE